MSSKYSVISKIDLKYKQSYKESNVWTLNPNYVANIGV